MSVRNAGYRSQRRRARLALIVTGKRYRRLVCSKGSYRVVQDRLTVTYCRLSGFPPPVNIWWHPQTCKFIEAELALRQLFQKSASSRSARTANEGLIGANSVRGNTQRRIVWPGETVPGCKNAKALFAKYALSMGALLVERYVDSATSDFLKGDLQKRSCGNSEKTVSDPCSAQGDSQRRTPISAASAGSGRLQACGAAFVPASANTARSRARSCPKFP